MRTARLLHAALACYPAWWRDRYGDEMEVVVDGLASEGRPPWRIAANLLSGALRARLRGTGSPPNAELWVDRTKAAILVATVPVFVVLPLGLLFLTSGGELGQGLGGQPVGHPSGAGRAALDLANVMSWAIAISVVVALSGWTTLLVRRSREGVDRSPSSVAGRGAARHGPRRRTGAVGGRWHGPAGRRGLLVVCLGHRPLDVPVPSARRSPDRPSRARSSGSVALSSSAPGG